jgi:Cu-Zn family superoxide dismutase
MSKLALTAALALFALPAIAQDGGATAVMMDQSGTNLGTLTLTEMDGSVRVAGELTGIPNGEHGFHIHATGTCDATTQFESAGAHFEPGSKQHGSENPEGPHAGDMANVVADDNGKAMVDVHNANVTLDALLDDDGAAIVLHADPDDYKTDPDGNAGDRFACGVIEGAP